MKRQGCLIICLLALGAFGAHSYPQEEQPDNLENREDSEAEVRDGYRPEGDVSYHEDSSERMRRDTRRFAPRQHRPQRILQAAENIRIEEIAHRLMELTRYYENSLGLTHQDAVNRMLAENPDAAYQVMRHAERIRPRPPAGAN